MDSRVLQVADQLLLIERELRMQGWWESDSPGEQALASQQPFCIDTLTFEQWLQWVFLPRMKYVLESGGPLPRASGIQAMAEQVYGASSAQAQRLIEVLGEFDRLITLAE